MPLADDGGALVPRAAETVLGRTGRADALVLGPGLGRDDGDGRVRPDGGGEGAGCRCCSTPTASTRTPAGWLRWPSRPRADRDDPARRRAGAAAASQTAPRSAPGAWTASARAAAEADAVVLLKGDDTLVADPVGRVGVNRGGAPALATAGTGDVLSGLIGAYLSKGMDPFAAACAGALVHARAGRLLAREIGPEGVIAGDVIGRCRGR